MNKKIHWPSILWALLLLIISAGLPWILIVAKFKITGQPIDSTDYIIGIITAYTGSIFTFLKYEMDIKHQELKHELVPQEPIVFAPSVEENFLRATDVIVNAPSNSDVYITEIARVMVSSRADIKKAVEEYEIKRDNQIVNKNLYPHRLVMIYTPDDFKRLYVHIKHSMKNENYEIRLYNGGIGKGTPPYFDWIIVRPRDSKDALTRSAAMMEFPPTESPDPKTLVAFQIKNPDVVDALYRNFQAIWNTTGNVPLLLNGVLIDTVLTGIAEQVGLKYPSDEFPKLKSPRQ